MTTGTPPRRGLHFLSHEGRSILPVGTHVVPAQGPDWPWRSDAAEFDGVFEQMARAGFTVARIDVLWSAVEPEAGRYDEAHLGVLDAIRESARRHGIWLHPALFIGNEVGDAFWDAPWRGSGNPHAEESLRAGQVAHARMLARRWRGDPVILGWDLTDEPPWWVCQDTTRDQARQWTIEVAGALREVDPGHLVTVGTASQEVAAGPFRSDTVADIVDFACVHPYPIYSPELYPDGLLDARMTHAGAFETALAAGAGRPVMVHEYGASSTQFDPDRIAAYDRLLMWSSFGRGAIGYLSWCWTDAEPAAYRRAPYVRQPHETQFGLVDHNGQPRPRARVNAEFARLARHLDLDSYAGAGPQPRASLVVPYEYAHPYDPRGYGLDGPSGRYTPAEPFLNPDPGVDTLVRGWLNAFVLAARAGTSVSLPREPVTDDWVARWPNPRLVLLPAPLASTTTSLWHVRTTFFDRVEEFWQRGGTVYLSCSSEVAIARMDLLAGCRIVDRAPARESAELRFVRRWGPLSTGDILQVPAAPLDTHTRGVRLAVTDGEVVAVDADGEPALVLARRASGYTVTCAHPVELLLGRIPDAHARYPDWWRLYAGVSDLAGAREDAWADHPDVTSGVLRGSRGGLVSLTNHADRPVRTRLHLPGSARRARRTDPGSEQPLDEAHTIELSAYSATIVVWDEDGDAMEEAA